jgi:peptide/nickel transport system substrate-binding protein
MLRPLVAVLAVFLMACGAAATATPPPATQAPAAAPTVGAVPAPATPTATPKPTAIAMPSVPARNKAVVVTEAEPASIGSWTQGCSGEIHSMGCQELTHDYLSCIDSKTFQVQLMSGFESYKQIAPDRWRYKIRPGVKFHNGEPFNAEAAKLGLDWNGMTDKPGNSASYTGITTGEVVDEYTVDAVCKVACPIFPRTGIFTEFVAPKWWATATPEQKNATTMGFGPYKTIGYRQGVDSQFEAYDGYVATPIFDGQKANIRFITHLYRAEATVRGAMLIAGEADWAADIGFDQKARVPQARQSGTTEVYELVLDTMWHPELKKQKVRLALAHAIDCQTLLDALFKGEIKCHAAMAPPGSVGITPANSKPREYNPALARQLLAEAGYDPKNEINIYSRPGSNIRGLEILEATVTFWRAVGVNSKLNAIGDLGKAREIQNAGCGNYQNAAGYKEKLDCVERGPFSLFPATSHAYEIATSDEILDMQRQGNARMGCFGRSSRVCYPDLMKKIDIASATPAGPERTRLFTEVADIGYQEVYFIPFFAVQMVYGLGKDVDWEPMYAPRFRGSTMKFK